VPGVEAAGFRILGSPPMHLFAFAPGEAGIDPNAVADALLARGWVVMRQPTDPPSLHLLLTPRYAQACEAFLADLAAATAEARASGARSGKTSGYTG